MAKIDIRLGVKNAMKAGLAKAKESLVKLKDSAVAIGKQMAKAFAAASAAAIAFGTKAIQAYAKQEGAERKLQAAIEASGESYKNAAPELLKLAAAIQDETGAADESTIANLALLKTLGIATSQLPAAAKGMIALEAAGLKGETAARALANAMQGNYTALQRYIPALKNAKTETDKQAILNEFLARGYQIQAAQLNTVSGQWNLLKSRLGDAMEVIGGAIVESRGLTEGMKQLGEWVKTTTQRFADWLKNGGIDQINASIKNIIDTVKRVIDLRFEIAIAAIGAASVAAVVKVATYAKQLQTLIKITKTTTVATTGMELAQKLVAKSSVAAAAGVTKLRMAMLGVAGIVFTAAAASVISLGKVIAETWRATEQLKKSMNDVASQDKDMMDKFGTRNASTVATAREMIKSGDPEKIATVERLFPKIAAAMREAEKAASGVSSAVDEITTATESAVDAQAELAAKIKALEKQREEIATKATGESASVQDAQEAAKKIKAIDDQITELKMSNVDKVMKAAKKAEDAATKAAKDRNDLLKQEADLVEDLRDAKIKALEDEKKAIEDAERDRIDALKAQQAEAQKLIDIGLQGVLAQKKADMESEKQAEKDARKAERLRKNLAIRGTLSKGDEKWLEAFDKINDAKVEADALGKNIMNNVLGAGRIDDINKEIANMKPTERKLDAINKELTQTRKLLSDNLKWG
jgi:hypothetical protein